jgi:ATP-dependent DNA helicase RecG
MALPVNIEDLLSARTVESDRIEFKEGWNPDAIYRSICAFANDFDNIGGGYILVGVAENPLTKTAVRPVKGLSTKQIGDIQQEMIGYNNLLKPNYATRLFVEEVDGKQIIVLWVIGGSERPYEVPENITAKHKTCKYFIRKYANSIEAKGAEKEELISLSNNIPFDDRVNTGAEISEISMLRLKDYLQKVNSKLAPEVGQQSNTEILNQMALISGPDEHRFPRNVALMLFTDKPHIYFPYTWVEIIYFPKGAGDKEFTEKKIEGPVQQQITDRLNWIKTNFLQEKIIKISGRVEAARMWNYPYTALEEVVANCLFHRNYQEREPVKIRIEPHAIILYNSGGPDRSIKREDFASGRVIPKRYRNRRLGDFLKELKLTEGHATGLPALKKAMAQNGSPEAIFDFDDERTWFQITLPIHPAFLAVNVPVVLAVNELTEIDDRVNQLLLIAPDRVRDKVRDVAGDIAGDVAAKAVRDKIAKNETSVAGDIVRAVDRDTVVDIAIDAHEFVNDKLEKILLFCQKPKKRKEILKEIGLVNNVKNYDTYVAPLVQMGWVRMTIPDKPTSPKQQYRTALKGSIISELLNYNDDGE